LLCIPSASFGAGGVVVPGKGYGNNMAPPKVQTSEELLKFVASGEQPVMGHKRIGVRFTQLNGAGNIVAYVPFKDQNSAEPDDKVAGPVAGLKEGDVALVTVGQVNGVLTITKIKAIDVKAGEENPHGYVFQESYPDPGSGAPIVHFTKYEQPLDATLPNVKDEKGKLAPDPELVTAVQTFKAGDVVYAEFAQAGRVPLLTAIYPYKEPQTGKVTKVSEQDVTGGKTTGVDIETADGKSITALVPGKVTNKRWVPDATKTRLVHSLKPGTEVEFLTHDDGGKTFLIDIAKAPPTPKTPVTPKPAPAASTPKKGK
jgi:Cu/Ag efflux protein CusF